MKTYQSQPNDSFASIAKKFSIKDENFLRTFHNLNCSENEVIFNEIPPGTTLLTPEDPQFLADKDDDIENNDEEVNAMNDEGESEPDPGEDTMDEETEEENKSAMTKKKRKRKTMKVVLLHTTENILSFPKVKPYVIKELNFRVSKLQATKNIIGMMKTESPIILS